MEISIETKNRKIEATKPVLKQAIDVYNLYGLVTVANQRKDSCSCKNCMAIPNATRDWFFEPNVVTDVNTQEDIAIRRTKIVFQKPG